MKAVAAVAQFSWAVVKWSAKAAAFVLLLVLCLLLGMCAAV